MPDEWIMLAASGEQVWLSIEDTDTLYKVTPDPISLESFQANDDLESVAVGDAAVWEVREAKGVYVRDPATGERTDDVFHEIENIAIPAIVGDTAWVPDEYRFVTPYDPLTAEPLGDPIETGPIWDLVGSGGTLWGRGDEGIVRIRNADS